MSKVPNSRSSSSSASSSSPPSSPSSASSSSSSSPPPPFSSPSSSSSCSSSSPRKHDVFLSFSGEDTRKSFTDHLYKSLRDKGIYTFRDDKKLERGKVIKLELLKSIEESRFAIVIFSKNYASSTWCLIELAKIVECKKKLGLIVLPVFYHVEQTEVIKQEGEFGEAFDKHKPISKDEIKNINEWREALTEAATIPGWHIKEKEGRYETVDIEEIAKFISEELNMTFSLSNNDLVGMDSHIEKMRYLLNIMQLDDVRTVGIWGMAGIGKTTIAEQVYKMISKTFDASAFISNVREKSKKNGKVYLQKRLYKYLLKDEGDIQNVEMGRNVLRNRLCSKRVLIILDDVEKLEQIEDLVGNAEEQHFWLGPGSRVIVTTEDKHLLKTYGENNIHNVGNLTHDEALQLFSRRAFKRNYAFDDFVKLSNDFVDYANHHPLALKVLGSFLFGRNVDQWSDTLVKLKRNPDRNVTCVLQVSYDGLDDEQKKIFLDIACFFKGEEEYRVKKIFEGCGLHPRTEIKLLIEKSLITIVRNKLWMHDLLQQFGHYIVREKFPEEPGKRSRIWFQEDACNVLVNNTGTEAVQGIFLSFPEKEKLGLRVDPMLQMKMLRLLKFQNVDFPECVGYLSNELRLLEWHGYPQKSLPSSFCPHKLVEFNMSSNRIERLWRETTHDLQMLISINLSNCMYLKQIPDLNRVPNLESLVLEGCKRLSKVHPSIGGLKKLVMLNLKGCESLKSLFSCFSLESLEIIILSGCKKLTRFPEIVGNMDRLHELHLDETAIKELPGSIMRFSELVLLSLKGCKNLLKLPDEICRVTTLRILDITGCSRVKQLPENIGSLEKLEKLVASGTAIRKASRSITLLKNLKILCFSECSKVPHTSWDSVFGCCLPPSEESIHFQLHNTLYAYLISLTSLCLRKCNLTEEGIPEDISCLSSLQRLDLGENNFVSLPDSVSQLFNLRVLFLEDCKRLEWLPKLPLSLTHAYVHGCPLLKNLKEEIWSSDRGFTFIHYENSYQIENSLVSNEELFQMLYSKTLEDNIYNGEVEKFGFECTRIPEWCRQQNIGCSTRVQLPVEDTGKAWMGFATLAVFQFQEGDILRGDGELSACFHFDTNKGHLGFEHFDMKNHQISGAGSYGVWIYVPRDKFGQNLNKASGVSASISTHGSHIKVYMCGMHIVFNEDMPDFCRKMAQLLNESMFLTYEIIRKPRGIEKFEEPRGAIKFQSYLHKRVRQENYRSDTESDLQRKTRRDLQWLVPTLVQRCYTHNYCFAFHFPLKVFPTWFFHHSVAPSVVCDVPMNLFDEKPWVGFCLYVQLTWPNNYLDSQTPLHLGFQFLVYGDDGDVYKIEYTIAIRHKLILLNMPRLYIRAVLNQCPGVRALFTTSNPDVEVEMCGIRPVNEDDLGNLIQMMIDITLSSGHFCYEEFGQLVEDSVTAVEFVEAKVEIPVDFDYYERESLKEILSGSKHFCQGFDEHVEDSSSVVEFGETPKLELPIGFGYYDRESLKEILSSTERICYFPFTSREKVGRPRLESSYQVIPVCTPKESYPACINLQIVAENALKVSDPIKWQRRIEESLEQLIEFDVVIALILKGHIISISKPFNPFSSYNFCFPQKEILGWFEGYQVKDRSMKIKVPSNLNDDKSWRGLAVCVSFSIHEHPTSILDHKSLEFSFQLKCDLKTEEHCFPPAKFLTNEFKFTWLCMRRFIWLTYIPSNVFAGHLNEKNYLKIVIFYNCPHVVATNLGTRFLYQQDVAELKQSIAKCSTSFFDNLDPIRQIMAHQHSESFFHFSHGCLKHLAEIAAYHGFENENPSLAARTESNYLIKGGVEFDRNMIYDSCFPLTEILDWFGHHNIGSSVTIQLPSYAYSDGYWIGLALCAYFSDLQHLTTPLDQEFHLNLTCQIKTEKVGLESQHEFEITNEDLEKLNSGEFIWVSYIPRLWFSDQLNQCSLIEASFASERQELSSYKCGLRLLYQHDEEEFKQTISRCMAFYSDSMSDSFTQEPSTRRTGRTTKQLERKDKGKQMILQ